MDLVWKGGVGYTVSGRENSNVVSSSMQQSGVPHVRRPFVLIVCGLEMAIVSSSPSQLGPSKLLSRLPCVFRPVSMVTFPGSPDRNTAFAPLMEVLLAVWM